MLPSSTILQQKQSFRNKARHIAAAYYPNNRQICSQAMFNRLKTLDVFYSHLPLFCFVGTEMDDIFFPHASIYFHIRLLFKKRDNLWKAGTETGHSLFYL